MNHKPVASQLFQIQTTVTKILYSDDIAQYHASEYLGYSHTMLFTPVRLLNGQHLGQWKELYSVSVLRAWRDFILILF